MQDGYIGIHQKTEDLGRCATPCLTQAWRHRADAILQRRTDRLPFRAPSESLDLVLRSSLNGLATLDVLADDARPRPAEATRPGHACLAARHVTAPDA